MQNDNTATNSEENLDSGALGSEAADVINDNTGQNTGQEQQEQTTDPIEALTVERDALQDKYMRSYAETENLRRRLAKEKTEAHQYAITSFARDLLGLADAFEQATKSLNTDNQPSKNDTQSALQEGFVMTQKELHRIFEKHGITAINPVNQPFNHDQHQAMMQVPATDEVPAGNVATVMQVGFLLNERLLRPALVAVAE